MNKILLSFCAVVIAFTSTAQTVPDAGMENWRSNSTGTTHAFTIYAPYSWYGFDSLLIADAELFSFVLHSGTKFHPQLFQESTIIHSGSSSAKVMTMRQDTLGLIPGSLSNASVTVNPAALLGGGSLASATKFNGGSPVNQRITTVSAWVQYLPGIDSVTGLWGGKDTARLTVQALGHIHGGNDTVVGIGGLQILPSTSFVQVTANLTYWDTAYLIDTIRIIFASSGGGASTCASCTGSATYCVMKSSTVDASSAVACWSSSRRSGSAAISARSVASPLSPRAATRPISAALMPSSARMAGAAMARLARSI